MKMKNLEVYVDAEILYTYFCFYLRDIKSLTF